MARINGHYHSIKTFFQITKIVTIDSKSNRENLDIQHTFDLLLTAYHYKAP